MHIKFIIHGIEMFRGGGEIYFLNITKGLEKLGCKVTFITTKPLFRHIKYPIEEFKTDYIASPYLRDFALRMTGITLFTDSKSFPWAQDIFKKICWRIGCWTYHLNYFIAQKRIFNFIRRNKIDYDIVQVHSLPDLAALIVDKLKIPVVIRFPGPPNLRHKKNIQKCSAVTASGSVVDVIKKHFRSDVYDIPQGVDTDLFDPVRNNNNIRRRYNIGNNPLLLFVGRFVPLKNLSFLINSFKEVVKKKNRVKLMLIGEGPLKKPIENLISKYKIQRNIIIVGGISHKELPSYYSSADIFILTSSYESFSNAILEAMSCALPIIGTNVGWLPNLIANGKNGFLVESNNIEELKNSILNLLNDKELCEEMGKRNREIVVKKYDWLKSAEKFKNIYESLL